MTTTVKKTEYDHLMYGTTTIMDFGKNICTSHQWAQTLKHYSDN